MPAADAGEDRFTGTLTMEIREASPGTAETAIDGKRAGNQLTDNNYVDDGYRYHDVFHLALAAVLGWSPTLRYIAGLPRKDRREHGRRAVMLDEGIVALAFKHLESRNFLQDGQRIDPQMLESFQSMTSHLTVPHPGIPDWERALSEGCRAWLTIRQHHGGTITADFDRRTMEVTTQDSRDHQTREALRAEMDEARRKAIESLARYKFAMFGYWSGVWVHLNRAGAFGETQPLPGVGGGSPEDAGAGQGQPHPGQDPVAPGTPGAAREHPQGGHGGMGQGKPPGQGKRQAGRRVRMGGRQEPGISLPDPRRRPHRRGFQFNG